MSSMRCRCRESKCLGDDVEVRVGGPVGPDTPEEPPGRRDIGHIGGPCLTRTASKHATDTATDVGDCRARITSSEKASDMPLK